MGNTIRKLSLFLACLALPSWASAQVYVTPGPVPVYPYAGAWWPRTGGYYNGLANYTTAFGQYIQDYHRARLLNEEVERAKLETQRMLIEHQRWLDSLRPRAEDVRRYQMERELNRAMNSPPLTDIISGDSLNTLLTYIQSQQVKGGDGPVIPLNQDSLKQINVAATGGSSVALFKNGSTLRFPFVLRDTPFEEDRLLIQDLVTRAVAEAVRDELSPTVVRGLRTATANLDAKLTQMAPEMSIPDSIEAHKFLNELNDGLHALERPTARAYLTKEIAAQGLSVGELVQYMTKNGLRFSPALAGEEGPYRALQQSLVAYSNGMTRQLTTIRQ
jgi:hypothetical protein